MTGKASVIRCPKCGHEPNTIEGTCPKCSAPLEKQCGGCGFSNSVEKNYCDQCGQMLMLHTQRLQSQNDAGPKKPAPKLEIQGLQDAVDERYNSFRNKQDPPPPPPPRGTPPPVQPEAAVRQGAAGAAAADGRRSGRRSGRHAARTAVLSGAYSPRKLTGPALGFGMILVLGGLLYIFVISPLMPRLRLTMTAKNYLSALASGRYEEAYETLSANSKASTTQESFVSNNKSYYSKVPRWEFRNVQVFRFEKDSALIKYQLREQGKDWKDDYLSFVREHDRWSRPYIWSLFQPIEDAMSRNDFIKAVFLAQKLYLTDPVDPRSSGYLCAAEFFSKLYDKSAESCNRTLEAAAAYPEIYNTEELFWFNLYYADSLRYQRRNRSAIDEFNKMLKLPTLSLQQQCPLFLNRADAYVDMRDYEKAMADTMRATEVCTTEPAKSEAANALLYMSGKALEQALNAAKRSSLRAGAPPVFLQRQKHLEALARRYGARGAKYLPKDAWLAAHATGPEYVVTLRQQVLSPERKRVETSDILIIRVNLWPKIPDVKVEKAEPFAMGTDK